MRQWMRALTFDELDQRRPCRSGLVGLIACGLAAEHPDTSRIVVANTGLPTGDLPMPDIWWRFREAIQGQPTIDVGWFDPRQCNQRPMTEAVRAGLRRLPRTAPTRPRICPAWSRRRLTIPRRRESRCVAGVVRQRDTDAGGLQRQRSHHRPDGGHLRSPVCAAPRASSIRSSMMPGTSFGDAGKTSRADRSPCVTQANC